MSVMPPGKLSEMDIFCNLDNVLILATLYLVKLCIELTSSSI